MSHQQTKSLLRKPEWLQRPPGTTEEVAAVKRLLRQHKLNTVCEEARCPNIAECFSRGTATFMILGDICTRGCRFCSVSTGKPQMKPSDFQIEADQVAQAAKGLNLRHVVVTSVARDDLDDGGASGFVATIRALRETVPGAKVEVLIPDLRGDVESIREIVNAVPDIINHNLETVPRLYRRVRPGSSYRRSLQLLSTVKELNPSIFTKTGIMLGLDETKEEVLQLFGDVKQHQVDILTGGQYLQPSLKHLSVERYLPPEEFMFYQEQALAMGIQTVFMGPLVRSSYNADEQFFGETALAKRLGS